MDNEFNLIDYYAFLNKSDSLKVKFNSLNIPRYIKKLIYENKIFDILNDDERAKIFLKLMFNEKISSTTIENHYKKLKPILFPTTKIVPNTLVFNENAKKQCRSPIDIHMEKLIFHIKSINEKYKWPLLFILYTGFRLNEVFELRASHIISLINKEEIIYIKRKKTNEWNVLYYDIFNSFVQELFSEFKKECEFFLEFDVNLKLFNYTSMLLHLKLREYFLLANKIEPPNGFGSHTFRYFIATKLVSENKLDIAKLFLGHKNIATTIRYIKYDKTKYSKKLKQINKTSEFYSDILNKLNSSENKGVKNKSTEDIIF